MKKFYLFLTMVAMVFATSCEDNGDESNGGYTGETGYVKSLTYTYDTPGESDTYYIGYDDSGRVTKLKLKSYWYSSDSDVYSMMQTTKSISEEDVQQVAKGMMPKNLMQPRGGKSTAATRASSTLKEYGMEMVITYNANSISIILTYDDGDKETASATLNSDGYIATFDWSNEDVWEEGNETYSVRGIDTYNYNTSGYLTSVDETYSYVYKYTSTGETFESGSGAEVYAYGWSNDNLISYEYNSWDDFTYTYGSNLNNLNIDLNGLFIVFSPWLSGLERGLMGESSTNLVVRSDNNYDDYENYDISTFEYIYINDILTSVAVKSGYGSDKDEAESNLDDDCNIAIAYYL